MRIVVFILGAFSVLLLPSGLLGGEVSSAAKNNRIYNVTVNTDWSYTQTNPEKANSISSEGKVEVAIKNNTNIPLTFYSIEIRHYCKQATSYSNSFVPASMDEIYSFDSTDVKPSATETKLVKSYKKQGPCSGEHGGVQRSEVVNVDFTQFGVKTPFDQNMKCGNDYVPVVWAMAPDLETYLIYTETRFFKYKFKYMSDREGKNPLPIADDQSVSLKRDICENKVSDSATLNRWSSYFVHFINQWGRACTKHPDECKKVYEEKHEGWLDGANNDRNNGGKKDSNAGTGVRD